MLTFIKINVTIALKTPHSRCTILDGSVRLNTMNNCGLQIYVKRSTNVKLQEYSSPRTSSAKIAAVFTHSRASKGGSGFSDDRYPQPLIV
jgi:hypothetical protein